MTGTELQKRRETMMLSPVELALILGVAADTVEQWESGEHSIPRSATKLLEDVEEDVLRNPSHRGSVEQMMRALRKAQPNRS